MAPTTRRASKSRRAALSKQASLPFATNLIGSFLTLKFRSSLRSPTSATASKPTPIDATTSIPQKPTTSGSTSRGIKRRRSEVETLNDADDGIHNKRRWSNESNPTARTRAQRLMLRTILDDSNAEDLDNMLIKTTEGATKVQQSTTQVQTTVKAADSAELASQDPSATPMEVVVTSVVTETRVEETRVEVTQNAQIDDSNLWANPDQVANILRFLEPNGSTMPSQAAGMDQVNGQGISTLPSQSATVTFGSQQIASTPTTGGKPRQKKGTPRRKGATVPKKVLKTTTMAAQSTLKAHLVERGPHPESQGMPWRQIKLKYARPGKHGMPVELFKELPLLNSRVINQKGVFDLSTKHDFWDNEKYGIKFGFSPYFRIIEPTATQCEVVWILLDRWLRAQNPPIIVEETGTGSNGPAHGGNGFTAGSIVKTVLAQNTGNELAIVAEKLCALAFPFIVNGKKVIGETPNYHAMAAASLEEIQAGISHGGLQQGKARGIKCAFEAARARNLKKTMDTNHGAIPAGTEMGQPADTATFVPGLLSMDFLYDMTMAEMFNWFIDIPGIGHKTAACFLEFNFGYPICAVDVHVLRMSKFLGWIPLEGFDEEKCFKHLEGRVPNHLKHRIHQGFWHHSQKCRRCKAGLARDEPGKPGDEACPLEYMMARFKTKKAEQAEKAKKVPKTKKPARTAEKKPAKRASKLPWEVFEDEEAATAAGYMASEWKLNDDFAAGSVNVSAQRAWLYMGVKTEETL